MTLRWGRWLTTWATFRKRIPALAGYAMTLFGALLESHLLDAVLARSTCESWAHKVAAFCLTFGPGVLLFTRSVATGSHGADYTSGLLPDRRGTGSRTGEMSAASTPAPTGGSGDLNAARDPATGEESTP